MDVSRFDTSKVTNMSEMFFLCEKLESLNVSSFNTSNVTDMSMMFYGCHSLPTLDVSGFDVSNVENMSEMFGYCIALEHLDLSGFDAGKATDMSDMLEFCNRLEKINTPINVSVSVTLPTSYWSWSDEGERIDSSMDFWADTSGKEWTELPQNSTTSILLNRIYPLAKGTKYVPYEIFYGPLQLLSDLDGEWEEGKEWKATLASGSLPDGLRLEENGKISGVPLTAGDFRLSIRWQDETGIDAVAMYRLIIQENTTPNVNDMSDPGYELIEFVSDLYLESQSGTHTLVSQGDYSEFVAVYLNGRKLTEGKDYTSASGSTRITIIDQTLTDEGVGTHTIGIEFRTADNTLRRAAQNYTVLAGKAPSENNNNNTNSSNGGSSVQPPAAPAEEETETVISYVVQRGDTLWKLAARYYGAGRFWTRIYQDNRDTIRSPHRLRVGQVLTIYLTDANEGPAETETFMDGDTYTVKSGDSLWRIARKCYGKGSLWQLIYQANQSRIANPNRIRTGQVFTIPVQ